MSSATQESSPTQQSRQVDDRTGLQKGIDWVGKHWPRVRLAHEGWMIDKIQRQQRFVEVAARNAMTGDMRDTSGLPTDGEGDDMGVRIGDDVVNNYITVLPSEQGEADASGTSSAETTPERPAAFKLLPWLLAAAIPASAGLGALGSYLLSKQQEPAAQAQGFEDTDWGLQVQKVGAEP